MRKLQVYWIAAQLTQPFFLCYLFALGTLANAWRTRRCSHRVLTWCTIAFALLTLSCTPAVAYLALGSLEWRYPPRTGHDKSRLPIVVLGGSLRPADDGSEGVQLADDTLIRCVHAAQLYRGGPRRPIVASGGKVDVSAPGPPLAHAMCDFLRQMGVNDEDILLEDGSRTTYENAVETEKLLRRRGIRRILLITEAIHLHRAKLCFEKAGVEVIPVGCQYRATSSPGSLYDLLPNPTAAADLNRVSHEWLGIVWYRLHGRI